MFSSTLMMDDDFDWLKFQTVPVKFWSEWLRGSSNNDPVLNRADMLLCNENVITAHRGAEGSVEDIARGRCSHVAPACRSVRSGSYGMFRLGLFECRSECLFCWLSIRKGREQHGLVWCRRRLFGYLPLLRWDFSLSSSSTATHTLAHMCACALCNQLALESSNLLLIYFKMKTFPHFKK